MSVIVYDNSTRKNGWAVFDNLGLLQHCGLVDCTKLAKMKLSLRINTIAEQVFSATREYYDWSLVNKTVVIGELPISGVNAGGALKQAMMLGALMNIVVTWGILEHSIPDFHVVNNQHWKKVACGKGNIGKPEYLAMARELYPEFEIKTDDVAAAILMGKAYFMGCEYD